MQLLPAEKLRDGSFVRDRSPPARFFQADASLTMSTQFLQLTPFCFSVFLLSRMASALSPADLFLSFWTSAKQYLKSEAPCAVAMTKPLTSKRFS